MRLWSVRRESRRAHAPLERRRARVRSPCAFGAWGCADAEPMHLRSIEGWACGDHAPWERGAFEAQGRGGGNPGRAHGNERIGTANQSGRAGRSGAGWSSPPRQVGTGAAEPAAGDGCGRSGGQGTASWNGRGGGDGWGRARGVGAKSEMGAAGTAAGAPDRGGRARGRQPEVPGRDGVRQERQAEKGRSGSGGQGSNKPETPRACDARLNAAPAPHHVKSPCGALRTV